MLLFVLLLDKQHHKYGQRSKEQIQPVSDAETDPKTGHKFNHHPPCHIGLRIMLIRSGLGCAALFRSRQFGLKLLHLLPLVRAGHTKIPLGISAAVLLSGRVRVNNLGHRRFSRLYSRLV